MRLFPLGDLSPKYHTFPEAMRRRGWPIVETVFPVWSLRHQARWLGAQFAPDLKAARDRNDTGEYDKIWQQMQFETNESRDRLDAIASRRLLAKGRKLHVLEAREIERDQNNWEEGNLGSTYLTNNAYRRLALLVHQAEREQCKFRMEIAKTMTAVLAAFTGIVGTITGLVAVLRK